MRVTELSKIIKKAPQNPGVYIFKNVRGTVLYVGKAVNLRSRLRSYTGRGWKEDMVKTAYSVVWEELPSDIGALIREAELIKKLSPHYNIWMRDDKNYSYVAFSKETFPRIWTTHQPDASLNANCIGPFTDAMALKRVLGLLRKVFPYCTCSSKVLHSRRCVNAQIGKCFGFCCTKEPHTKKDIARYRANIQAIKKILSGKSRLLRKELEQKMRAASVAQKYEEASILRDQFSSVTRIFEHSPYLKRDMESEREHALVTLKNLLSLKEVPERIEGYDISHHQGDAQVASMVVFQGGLPDKSQYRKFIIKSIEGINDPASIAEVLSRRLKHPEWPMPDLFLIDGGKGQLGAAARILKKQNVVSIAKREEELYTLHSKQPFALKKLPPPLLALITHIRDESHRFAISFHRSRRRKLTIR